MSDLYETKAPWLLNINPLARLAATVPAIGGLAVMRDPIALGAASGATACAIVWGTRPSLWAVAMVATAMTVMGAWTAAVFTLVTRLDLVTHSAVVFDGMVRVHVGALEIGAATALRLNAIALMVLLGSLGVRTDRLACCLVMQGRLPYRFVEGVLAGLRFIRRYRKDLLTLRLAHRARGAIGPHTRARYVHQMQRLALPLIAGGARHAERLALAMDARGFGAHRVRTYRNPTVMRTRDFFFILTVWVMVPVAYAV